MNSGAVIEGNYRYLLWREWDSDRKTVAFIMLNPNSADAEVNDPTVTRCINFAKSGAIGKSWLALGRSPSSLFEIARVREDFEI